MKMKEIIFHGDDVLLYDFPKQTEIFYAKEPLDPLEDEVAAIERAIDNPIQSKNLSELVDSNSKVAICFDDISVPLPLMKNDVRNIAAKAVLKKLKSIGVKKENIVFICATGLHRKCKPDELSHILGKSVYKQYKDQILNHDAEDKKNLKILGTTEEGFEVEINKTAAESDLIIYLNISFIPLNGGWKSIIVGLGSYKTIIPHHSPEILKNASFNDPHTSDLHRIIWEMGEAIKDKIKVFTIEMAVNNNFFSGVFKKLYSPIREDKENLSKWKKMALFLIRQMPRFIKSRVRNKMRANYELIGVFAGDIEKSHEKILELVEKQLFVPIDKQYDVIIYGVPNMSPYNVGSALNPLLLHGLVCGYLFNMYSGRCPLKKNGIVIISNPAYDNFDSKQHPSYKNFFHDVLTRKPDIFDLKNIEKAYLKNEDYINKYRHKFAYHGTHAPIIYYWGVLGLQNIDKVIVAGAKSRKTLDILGYDHAKDLDEAIEECKREKGDSLSMAYFCIPPIFIAELNIK